jgi:hypothetical protein
LFAAADVRWAPFRALAAVLALVAAQAHGQTTLTIHSENDFYVFRNSDRYYTQGLMVEFRHRLSESRWGWGVSAAQTIYTPSRIDLVIPAPEDRPYGGWLSFTGSALFQTEIDDPIWRLEARLGVGALGPASGADWVQTEWHRFLRGQGDSPGNPEGWAAQIPGEVTLQLGMRAERLLDVWPSHSTFRHFDLRALGEVNVGTVFGDIAFGIVARAGLISKHTRVQSPIPSLTALARLEDESAPPTRSFGEVYVFARLLQRFVFRNAFLDGPLSGGGPSVPKAPVVGELEAGLAGRVWRFELQVAAVMRGQEMAAPLPGADHLHAFARLRLNVWFD